MACDAADDDDAVACRTLEDYTGEFLEKEAKADKKAAGRRRRPKSGEILEKTRARKEKGKKKNKGEKASAKGKTKGEPKS
jgi:hypothetical protein